MNKLSSLAIALVTLAAPIHAAAACGDGILDGTDACDDGNVVAGDGCSATCTVETGFACRTQTPVPVLDGSFEGANPMTPGGAWTVVAGTNIDWVDATFVAVGDVAACWPAGEGRRSIDMNGSTKGQMYQDLPTVAGTRYVVTFLGNANCVEAAGVSCSSTCTKRLTVAVADPADMASPYTVQVYDLRGQNTAPWQSARFEFVARGASTRLLFTGSDPSFAGPMIDRVVIPASVCDPTTCGDGTVGAGETCDDGNRASGDGCSASCQTEPGYTCATAGAACTTTCGDSIVAGTEQCDDGGTATGDGCSATCTIEIGWSCVIDPFRNVSACTMTCGNGTPDPGEQCDDGNTTDQDACSNRCLLGPGVTCVVSPQCALGLCSMGTCAGCYDTAGPGLRDFGCGTTFQVCDTAAMFPACVQCVIDADCAATETCLVGGMICVPRGVDAGTDAGSDAGSDAGTDAGADAGTDAGSDAGVDAGSDAGPRDAGGSDAAMSFDGGVDAGPRVGGASGGACTCSLHARPRGAAWSILTGLVLAGLVARRRRTR